MTDIEGYEIAEIAAPSPAQIIAGMDSAERANIDIQVSTAHAYPRNIQRCINNSKAIACLSVESAQSCRYALPRGGKPITGPSVHLAKLLAQNYGNLRAEAKVVQITDTQVISRGTAWDLENNYAVAFEVRRSIIGKNGRYSEDMITVTGNASNSIAYRNAVFAIIPKGITDEVYKAVNRKITGDLSDEDKLNSRRTAAIKFFNDEYNISEEEVIKLCGKQTVNQIRAEEIALLLGIQQSLKDGDTTVDDLMRPIRESKEVKTNKIANIAANKAAAKTQKKQQQPAETLPMDDVDPETGEILNNENPDNTQE